MWLRSMFVACFMMLFSALPVLAATFDLGTVNGTPGQQVIVPITLTTGGAQISALSIDIGFDATQVSVPMNAGNTAPLAATRGPAITVTDENGDPIKSIAQSIPSPGVLRLGISGTNTIAIGDGVVANVKFNVLAVASGTLVLTNTPGASAPNGTPVTITGSNGQIILPAVAPSITAFTLPATGTSLTVTFTTLTGSATTTAYLISESSATPTAGDANWKTTKPTSYTFTSYGAKTLYAWAKDNAGNISTAAVSATTTLTEPAATVTVFSIPSTGTSLIIPITTFTASSNAVAYLITESATAPAASAITATTPPTTFTVIGFTAHTLYAWVKNASGAVSASATATITLTDPSAILPILTVTAPADNTFTGTNTVTVTGTATQNPAAGSGAIASVKVNGVDVTLGQGGAFSKSVTLIEGANTITVVATDNLTPAHTTTVSRNVTYDKTPPTLSVSTLSNGSTTKVSPLNVAGTATDASGIKSVTVNGASVTLGTNGAFSYPLPLTVEGPVTITVVATDNTDNVTTDTRTITYDITPMTLTITTPSDNGQTKDAALTVTGTISETGGTVEIKNTTSSTTSTNVVVTGTGYTGTIQLATGSNTIEVTVTDAAGNKSTAAKRTILYDPNSPSLAITDPAHDIQVSSANYTLKGTVSDATAIVVTLTFNGTTYTPAVTAGQFEQAITIPAEGQYQAVATATDAVGNPPSTATRNIIYTPFPADGDGDGSTTIADALKAFQYTLGQGTLTDTEKRRLDVAPLGADGKPSPDGVVDAGDVILMLRRIIGLVNF